MSQPSPDTTSRPRVLLFDVNETLSDLSPLAARFVELGAPASLASLWFATVLRDGFALTAAGENPAFSDVARSALRHLLDEQTATLNRSVDEAAEHVLAGFGTLEPHADVPHGIRMLAEQGHRLVTLSNGAPAVAERLLGDAGLLEHVDRLLSVEDAPAWKPHPSAYHYAAEACGVEPAQMLMVASHPWDLDGAARAGLVTAWVNRSAAGYPSAFSPPTYTVDGLESLAEVLG